MTDNMQRARERISDDEFNVDWETAQQLIRNDRERWT